PRSDLLEARLARWLGVEPANVLAGNGTTQLIYLISKVLEPARSFVAIPTFSEIANALAIFGLPALPIQLDPTSSYAFEREPIEAAINSHASAIFLGHPNSPTGSMLSARDARELADQCLHRGCWCVFDEAFIDYVADAVSMVQLVPENHRVIVLRSLTKAFAIPGLRVGCLVADPAVIESLRAAMEPWSVNAIAERVTLACLDEAADYLDRTRLIVAQERDYVLNALSGLEGIRLFPSVANFLMLRVEEAAP